MPACNTKTVSNIHFEGECDLTLEDDGKCLNSNLTKIQEMQQPVKWLPKWSPKWLTKEIYHVGLK